MAYESEKKKVTKFIETYVIDLINKDDYDYYAILDLIVKQTRCTRRSSKDVLDNFISMELIQENRILTIPDKKLDDNLTQKFEQEKEAKEKKKETEKDLKLLEEKGNGKKGNKKAK